MLFLALISAFLTLSFAQLCDPYAVRVSLGYYYTYENTAADQLDIQYNTNVTECLSTTRSRPVLIPTFSSAARSTLQSKPNSSTWAKSTLAPI